jgi:hypothetical protein
MARQKVVATLATSLEDPKRVMFAFADAALDQGKRPVLHLHLRKEPS